jgi:acetoin utilization protein AcuC
MTNGAVPVTVVWDPAMLAYNLGDHPMDPVRVELTVELARGLGILDRENVLIVPPTPADDATLTRVHTPDYVAAVRAAPHDPFWRGYGLNTPDNPVFHDMHEASALVAGASVTAAQAVWDGTTTRAVNISGGLHHAMRNRASGFCVYNDVSVAIRRLLDLGAQRVAYIDVDVHHGDGVQAEFWNDPRVLTVSIHESPLTLFPGTGFPSETGGEDAEGAAVNIALPAGTGDEGWLRAFNAVVPGVVRAFAPEVIVSQCGCDSHRSDPLADLLLTVDGQRQSYLAIRDLADELCGGRWIAFGGGGYGLVDVVPRAWTHLLAIVSGAPLDPHTAIPNAWRALALDRRRGSCPPTSMTDDGVTEFRPWQPGSEPTPLDRAVEAARRAVYPLHGLDPDDPRD